MSIESPADLAGLKRAGAVTRAVLRAMQAAVRPGITTFEIDRIAGSVLLQHGAHSAPKRVYGFPGNTCISVNDEAVHGIPGSRRLAPGDLVKLDVTVEVGGYMADACETVAVPPIGVEQQRLIGCARSAFQRGLDRVRSGAITLEIGESIHREVTAHGFSVVHGLAGHGIGRTIHEPPIIPNQRDLSCRTKLTPGMVFTIEPIIAAGGPRADLERDGWTMRTQDHSLAAHYEQTVFVTPKGVQMLTA